MKQKSGKKMRPFFLFGHEEGKKWEMRPMELVSVGAHKLIPLISFKLSRNERKKTVLLEAQLLL